MARFGREGVTVGGAKSPASAWVWWLAALVLMALVAVLAIRSATIGMLFSAGDDAPLAWVANSPEAQEIALHQAATAGVSATEAPALAAQARRQIARNPLSLNAPFALGVALTAEGHTVEARRVMAIAEARNPRNAVVRSWVATDAIQRGDLAGAVFALDGVMRMRPALVMPITHAMVPFLHAPQVSSAFVAVARGRPPWLNSFIDAARRDPSVAQGTYAVMGGIAAEAPGAVTRTTVNAVVQSALARGDVGAARAVYAAFYPLAAVDRANGIFDASFQRQGGDAPFGWTAGSEISGTLVGGDGATVLDLRQAEGTRHLSQQLIVAPGRYRLSTDVNVSELSPAAALRWSIICQGSDVALTSLPISAAAVAARTLSVDFDLPANCVAPTLALDSAAGASGRVQLNSVALRSAS